MSKIMYKDKPYMSTTDLPEMTLTEARTGTEEEPRVISPKTLFEFAVNRLTGNIDIDTSAASGDDYDLTQALTSLGWLSDVVTSGVLGAKKLLYKTLMATPRKVTITGTTSASGALQIPSAYTTKPLFGAYREGSPATMIYRRDASCLMVMNASNGNTFTALANQSVTINAWTIG